MVPPFDIFRLDKDGSLQWLQTADSLQAAQLRIEVLGLSAPGQYVIFSQQTGHKAVVTTEKRQED